MFTDKSFNNRHSSRKMLFIDRVINENIIRLRGLLYTVKCKIFPEAEISPEKTTQNIRNIQNISKKTTGKKKTKRVLCESNEMCNCCVVCGEKVSGEEFMEIYLQTFKYIDICSMEESIIFEQTLSKILLERPICITDKYFTYEPISDLVIQYMTFYDEALDYCEKEKYSTCNNRNWIKYLFYSNIILDFTQMLLMLCDSPFNSPYKIMVEEQKMALHFHKYVIFSIDYLHSSFKEDENTIVYGTLIEKIHELLSHLILVLSDTMKFPYRELNKCTMEELMVPKKTTIYNDTDIDDDIPPDTEQKRSLIFNNHDLSDIENGLATYYANHKRYYITTEKIDNGKTMEELQEEKYYEDIKYMDELEIKIHLFYMTLFSMDAKYYYCRLMRHYISLLVDISSTDNDGGEKDKILWGRLIYKLYYIHLYGLVGSIDDFFVDYSNYFYSSHENLEKSSSLEEKGIILLDAYFNFVQDIESGLVLNSDMFSSICQLAYDDYVSGDQFKYFTYYAKDMMKRYYGWRVNKKRDETVSNSYFNRGRMECQNMLYITLEMGFIDNDTFNKQLSKLFTGEGPVDEIKTNIIPGLVKIYLEECENKKKSRENDQLEKILNMEKMLENNTRREERLLETSSSSCTDGSTELTNNLYSLYAEYGSTKLSNNRKKKVKLEIEKTEEKMLDEIGYVKPYSEEVKDTRKSVKLRGKYLSYYQNLVNGGSKSDIEQSISLLLFLGFDLKITRESSHVIVRPSKLDQLPIDIKNIVLVSRNYMKIYQCKMLLSLIRKYIDVE